MMYGQTDQDHAANPIDSSTSATKSRGINAAIGNVTRNKWLFPSMLIIVLLLGLYVRSGLLKYQGFYEPDGFFYYALAKATISNNFAVPKALNLSGFPAHQPTGEAPGLAYLPAIIYLFLGFLGINVLQIMRVLPVVTGILEIAVALLLSWRLFSSRWIALLAAFFVAVSIANIARTGALVYRGDTFISLVITSAMLLAFMALEEKDKARTYLLALASGFILSLGLVMWNGASFAMAVYAIAVMLVFIYSFLMADTWLIGKNSALASGLLFAYILDRVFIHLGLAISGYPLYGDISLALYILLAATSFAGAHLLRTGRKPAALSTMKGRAVLLTAAAAIAIVVMLVVFGTLISSFSVDYFAYPHSANAMDHQIANALKSTTLELQSPSLAFLFGSFNVQLFLAPIGAILLALLLARGLTPKPGDRAAMPEALLMLAYLSVAAYLELRVTRFSSLLSIPAAIFAAYALFTIGSEACKKAGGKPLQLYLLIAIAVFVLLYDMYYAFAFNAVNAPADGINHDFLGAMSWMRNNTAANATVITEWSEGSVVEGWANRTSLMDSVGGQHRLFLYNFTYNFTRFLFNTTSNTAYLAEARPQYLVVRTLWLNQTAYLAPEGLLNATAYSYAILTNATLSGGGSQQQILTFTAPSYSVSVVMQIGSSGINATNASFISGGSRQPIDYIVTYNSADHTYALSQGGAPTSLGYALFIGYSGTTITNAYLVRKPLFESNLFKLLFLCNYGSCSSLNAGNVTFEPVYINNDTRILKLTYR